MVPNILSPGCMAERLKTQIVEKEKVVDVVCGPDAYRDLPRLLAVTTTKQAGGSIISPPPPSLSLPPPHPCPACMAEQSKTEIHVVEKEKVVDVVCGPNAYRDLPRLLTVTTTKQAGGNISPSPNTNA